MSKLLFVFLLTISLTSCETPSKATNSTKTKSTTNASNLMCDCFKKRNLNDSPVDGGSIISCMSDSARKDIGKYYEELSYAFYNCPELIIRINEQDLYVGIDTTNFKSATSKICENFRLGKWSDIRNEDGSYSFNDGQNIYHYEKHELIGTWKIISVENCSFTCVVKDQLGEYNLPPNVGDTVKMKTLSYYGDTVISVMSFGKLNLKSVGIKLL